MRYIFFILIFMPLGLLAQQGEKAAAKSSDKIIQAPADSVKTLPPSLQKAFQEIIEDSLAATMHGSEESVGVDMGLIIVNETRTRHGAEFYDRFYQDLTLQGGMESATVIVQEEPFRGTTTRLLIQVNDVEVVQGILRPNAGEYLEQLLSSAVERVTYYVNNYQEVQESLNGEDLSGSGMY